MKSLKSDVRQVQLSKLLASAMCPYCENEDIYDLLGPPIYKCERCARVFYAEKEVAVQVNSYKIEMEEDNDKEQKENSDKERT